MSNHNMASSKRRSSVLKSKPRLPLTEVEFNKPTPTNTAGKSRRVSFSRTNGVAEFVVNEATTTWRNIYEQNRTLDSSGNYSELQRATTMTNKSLHQQFTELEVEIDCTTLGNMAHAPGTNVTMFNDMNFTEQLASLDCITGDQSLKLPSQNYDVSVMGEKSRVFSDGFANPIFVDQSSGLEVDFSMIQQVRQTELETDDLSDIVKDLEKSNPTIASSFLNEFNNRFNYVDVDLNVTKGFHDISDMSITDTIQRPTTPALAQSVTHGEDKKKPSFDRIADKENIIGESFAKPFEDPYPRSDENVLVFDGRKLKVANLHDKIDDIVNETPGNVVLNSQPFLFDRQKDKKNVTEIAKQHTFYNTIVAGQVNLMTEISLIYEDNNKENIIKPTVSIRGAEFRGSAKEFPQRPPQFHQSAVDGLMVFDTEDSVSNLPIPAPELGTKLSDMSTTQAIPSYDHAVLEKHRTTVFTKHDDLVGMSITQAIRQNARTEGTIPTDKKHSNKPPSQDIESKSQTTVFNKNGKEAEVSMTQGIPQFPEKRRTIIFDRHDDIGDMSMTQAIPAYDHAVLEKHKTIVFDKHDDLADMSITQAIRQMDRTKGMILNDEEHLNKSLSQDIKNKNQTIFYNKNQTIFYNNNYNEADMSVTQGIPQCSEKRRTVIFDKHDNIGDMSMTQAIPAYDAAVLEIRRTTVFDKNDNLADISINKVIPQKAGAEGVIPTDKKHSNKPPTQDIKSESQTTVFNKNGNETDMSMTQGIPQFPEKGRTIIFDRHDDIGDMSMTQAIPAYDHAVLEKHKTIVFDKHDDLADMSITQAIRQMDRTKGMILNDEEHLNKSLSQDIKNKNQTIFYNKNQTIFYNKNDNEADMSVTQGISQCSEKRRTVIFDKHDNIGDMSMTQAIPAYDAAVLEIRRTTVFDKNDNLADISINKVIPQKASAESVIPTDKKHSNKPPTQDIKSESQTTVFNKNGNEADMSMTQGIPQFPEKRSTIIFDRHDNIADMSMTKAIPAYDHAVLEKHRTIVFDKHDDLADMSITQDIPQKARTEGTILNDKEHSNKSSSQDIKNKSQTVFFNKNGNEADMSVTQGIPQCSEKKRTIILDEHDNISHMSTTQAIPMLDPAVLEKLRTDKHNVLADMPITRAIPQNARTEGTIPNDKEHLNRPSSQDIKSKSQTTVFNKNGNEADVSMTQDIPQFPEKRTLIFDRRDKIADMSMTQAITSTTGTEKRKTTNCSTVHLKKMSSNSTENKESGNTSDGRKSGFTYQNIRKSIILSRQEILNNISMAQTLLQRSRFNIDETDTTMDEESVQDLSTEQEPHTTASKSIRLSKDVVKTLKFVDDDSLCHQPKEQTKLPFSVVLKSNYNDDFNPKCNTKISKVITGLNDRAIDNIKDLVAHLVKPTADLPPYSDSQPTKERNVDLANACLQCNIETPSQNDIEDEQLQTKICQPLEVQADLKCNDAAEVGKKSGVSFNPNYLPFSSSGEFNMERIVDSTLARIANRQQHSIREENETCSSSGTSQKPLEKDQSGSGKPIIFDKNNTLNTLVLASFSCDNNSPVSRKIPHCLIQSPRQETKSVGEIKFDAHNPLNNVCQKLENVSKMSTPDELWTKSSDTSVAYLKQSIMMDALQGNAFYTATSSRSPDKHNKDKIKGDTAHNSRKRSLSPTNYGKHRNCTLGTLEVTPKPQEKRQKASTSPFITQSEYAKLRNIVRGVTKVNSPGKIKPSAVGCGRPVSSDENQNNLPNHVNPQKSRSSTKFGSPKSHDRNSPIKTCRKAIRLPSPPADRDDAMDKVDSEVLTSKSDVISSSNYNTGKNHTDHHPTDAIRISRVLRDADAMLDDECECDGGDIIGTSSGSEVSLDDSLQKSMDVPKSNDIITMIDQLPFMGTWCCKWEHAAADEWSFLLMHARVRLRVKLAHCSENGLGAGVIPHTPVESVRVDSLGEPDHAVAALCVRACVEALCVECAAAGCDSMERVPGLLPRCAGIARASMQWGRAMQCARMHLAYTLAPDGQLRLKVANVPLRSVWEVSMRVCVGAHADSPGDEWPRAADVRAALLERDAAPEDIAELLRAVPRGWGHVPATIWKVFKYFKHKTKEDDWMLELLKTHAAR